LPRSSVEYFSGHRSRKAHPDGQDREPRRQVEREDATFSGKLRA
jgi:hypothetical protein